MPKSYGTNRDAIECANSEIQKYATIRSAVTE